MPPQRITIPISRYGERARRSLVLAGIDYQELHHLRMFSRLFARGHAREHPPVQLQPALAKLGRV